MKHLPGLQDVSSDQQNGGLNQLMNYDRVTAAKLGQTVQSLDSTLYSAFGQSEVSIIYTQLNQYYVVLEVAPQYWQSPEGLKSIYLRTTAQRWDSVAGGRQGTGQHHASRDQPYRPIPVSHAVLQPGVERVLERRHLEHQSNAEAAGHALHDAGFFCRHAAGLPAISRVRSLYWF